MDQAISQLAQETKGLGRYTVVSHGDYQDQVLNIGIKQVVTMIFHFLITGGSVLN